MSEAVARAARRRSRQERDRVAQGWCPSTYRLFEAPDGLLARVKVPGGILRTDQLAAVADAADRFGDGVVEITSRANLQLRGIRADSADALRADLDEAGLVAPTEAAEDRRNVLASPTAGIDPSELMDVRPLVTATVAALDALSGIETLPQKFGVLIDGGGRHTLRGRRLDVTLGAVQTDGGEVVFEVCLGAALPVRERAGDLVLTVDISRVADLAGAAAEVSAAAPGRLADLVAGSGASVVVAAVESRLGAPVTRIDPGSITPPTGPVLDAPPLGAHSARDAGTVFVGIRPESTILTASALHALAAVLDEGGRDEVRLTPWRSVVVADVAADAAASLLDAARGAGWISHAAAPGPTRTVVGASR